MVETRGFLAAVEAADAMCKTASVRLMRCEVVRDARVTIVVQGEVAEVEAAVRAGGRAASRVGELLGTHVIPALETDVVECWQAAAGKSPRRNEGSRGRSA